MRLLRRATLLYLLDRLLRTSFRFRHHRLRLFGDIDIRTCGSLPLELLLEQLVFLSQGFDLVPQGGQLRLPPLPGLPRTLTVLQ